MMKKLVAVFLLIAMCLALFGCDSKSIGIIGGADGPTDIIVEEKEAEKTQKEISPLLYKVTDDEGNVAWLFGSVHVGVDEFYPLPQYVMDAYESADALAVEVDTIRFQKDENAMQEYFFEPMKYKDGSTIKDHISESTYKQAVEILTEYGKYESTNDEYMPAMWSSAIDQCTYEKLSYDMDKGIDNYFMKLAYETGKEVSEVEGAWYHFGQLSNLSEDVQTMMLENSIAQHSNIEMSKQSFDAMVDMWASGDDESLRQMLCQKPQFANTKQKEIYNEYQTAMISERDYYMTEFVKDTLGYKEMFVCVGAAHIVGENGVVDRLKREGYSVEKVE